MLRSETSVFSAYGCDNEKSHKAVRDIRQREVRRTCVCFVCVLGLLVCVCVVCLFVCVGFNVSQAKPNVV